MKNTLKIAGLMIGLAMAVSPAFAKPVTNTSARVHSATIHDRGSRPHTHQYVAHH